MLYRKAKTKSMVIPTLARRGNVSASNNYEGATARCTDDQNRANEIYDSNLYCKLLLLLPSRNANPRLSSQ